MRPLRIVCSVAVVSYKELRVTPQGLLGPPETSERFHQELDHPTFLFHGIDFLLDEISPKADRVAFSDGANLCIYDDTAGKPIAKIEIPQKSPVLPELPTDASPEDVKSNKELASMSRLAAPAEIKRDSARPTVPRRSSRRWQGTNRPLADDHRRDDFQSRTK